MLQEPENLKLAIDHLKSDPLLAKIILHCQPPEYTLTTDPFLALCRAIVFQQLSGKAASTIFGRLETLTQSQINPQKISCLTTEEMRSVGISRPKATYLKDLSERFLDGRLHPTKWHQLPDDEVRKEITSVKGLGDWSADMFLMFALCRPNIWPTLDQGIRNAAKSLKKQENYLSKSELEELAEPWRPYRTVAAHYLWRSLEIITPEA